MNNVELFDDALNRAVIEKAAVNDAEEHNVDPLTRLRAILDCLEKFRVDIEKALWYGGGTHTFDYVCQRVLVGELDLYELRNSVLLCEHMRFPSYDVYNVYIAAGNIDEITSFDGRLCKEARLRGCVKVSFSGRFGWKKPLERIGWKPAYLTMAKDV